MEPMHVAIEQAFEGIEKCHGGPFGAAISIDGKVISSGHNTVLRDFDPTCHAEVNAIRNACKILKTPHLHGATLYTTAEPCPMCLSAIYWARIDKIYVGVDRACIAKYGFDDAKFYLEVAKLPEQREVKHQFGVLSKECEQVFIKWKELGGKLY